MKGRKPKTTRQKKLEGNPGKRKLPKAEIISTGTSQCPRWLRNEAKNEWNRMVPELTAMGLLTKIDRSMLATYCQAYAKWKEAEEYLTEHGSTYQYARRDDAGAIISIYIAPFPQVAISKGCLEQMNKFYLEFGCTPISRTRLSVVKKESENDPMEKLLTFCGVEPKK